MGKYLIGDVENPLTFEGEAFNSGDEIELSDFDFERLVSYFPLTPVERAKPAKTPPKEPVVEEPTADETSSDAETIVDDEDVDDGEQAAAKSTPRSAGSRRSASES